MLHIVESLTLYDIVRLGVNQQRNLYRLLELFRRCTRMKTFFCCLRADTVETEIFVYRRNESMNDFRSDATVALVAKIRERVVEWQNIDGDR